MIHLHFYAMLRDEIGGAQIDLPLSEGATIRTAFKTLIERFPGLEARLFDAQGRLSPHMIVFLNDRDILLEEGLDTALFDGAQVKVFPQISGG